MLRICFQESQFLLFLQDLQGNEGCDNLKVAFQAFRLLKAGDANIILYNYDILYNHTQDQVVRERVCIFHL